MRVTILVRTVISAVLLVAAARYIRHLLNVLSAAGMDLAALLPFSFQRSLCSIPIPLWGP
jgi:hypothetical protein